MVRIWKISIIICSFSVICCTHQSERRSQGQLFFSHSSDDPIRIEINQKDEIDVLGDQAFDSVSFVRLSNEPDAIVSSVDQIVLQDSLILVCDRFGTGLVKAFSLKGDYLGNVGNKGRGPGEYVQPTHVESSKNQIIIWDQFSQQLNYYGMDLKFQYSNQMKYFALKFHQLDSNRIVFHSVNSDNDRSLMDYTIYVTDSLSNMVSKGFYRKKGTYSSLWMSHDLFADDSLMYYHPVYCDTIYSISSTYSSKALYYCDFGSKTVPERLRRGHHRKEYQKAQSGEEFSFMMGDFYVSGEYLLFQYSRAHDVYTGLYSNVSDSLIVFHKQNMKNILFFPLYCDNFMTSTDNAFVGYFFPSKMVPYTSQFSIEDRDTLVKQIGKERTDLVYSMKNDDNPIITFFYPSF